MKAFLFVLLATVLEATGDAVMRMALRTHTPVYRTLLFLGGGLLLALYGTSLNLAPVEFAAVTGMYIATLFVVFQVMNYLIFNTWPTPGVLAGGVLIVLGGAIAYLWK